MPVAGTPSLQEPSQESEGVMILHWTPPAVDHHKHWLNQMRLQLCLQLQLQFFMLLPQETRSRMRRNAFISYAFGCVLGFSPRQQLLPLVLTRRHVYEQSHHIIMNPHWAWVNGEDEYWRIPPASMRPLRTQDGTRFESAMFVINNLHVCERTTLPILDFSEALDAAYYAGAFLGIEKVKIVINLGIFTLINDFVPLLRAMRQVQSVATCTVEINTPYHTGRFDFNDYMIITSITRTLNRANINDPQSLNEFEEARYLAEVVLTTDIFPEEWAHPQYISYPSYPGNETFVANVDNIEDFVAINGALIRRHSHMNVEDGPFQPGAVFQFTEHSLLFL